MSNAVRHSASTEAFVTLERIDQDVVLRVVDAGCGFDPVAKRQAAGLGLVSMRERARCRRRDADGYLLAGTRHTESRHECATPPRLRRSPILATPRPFTAPPDVLALKPPVVRAVGYVTAAYPGWVAHRHRDARR